MKWLLIFLLLKSDGSVEERRIQLGTQEQCQQIGSAWTAQANHSEGGVGRFECVKR